MGDTIPYWCSGITRGDIYSATTRVVDDTGRYDGSNIGVARWLEFQLPPNSISVFAVNVNVSGIWRPARPTTPRFNQYFAHTWLSSPFSFTPLYSAGSSALSDSTDWLRVSVGQATLAPEQIEIWYGRAVDYLDVGDNETQLPDWTWGIVVLEAWMTTMLKHIPVLGENLKGMFSYFQSITDLLETVRINSMVRLRRFSSMTPSLLERNIVYNYARSQ